MEIKNVADNKKKNKNKNCFDSFSIHLFILRNERVP